MAYLDRSRQSIQPQSSPQPFWWHQVPLMKKWTDIPAQTVSSPEYKELKKYIHMPYRKIDHNQTKCFYFPTYVIFKIKNITEFDFDSLSANINGVLLIHIRVDYKNHVSLKQNDPEKQKVRQALRRLFQRKEDKKKEDQDQEIKEEEVALNKFLYIQFNRDNPLRLPSKRVFQGQIKFEKSSKQEGTILKWTIRKQFTIALSPGTIKQELIAPFNLLNFKLMLSFEDINIQLPSINDLNLKNVSQSFDENSRKYREKVIFKFNCMKRVGNHQEQRRIFEQLNFTDDGSLGEYDLAETGLNVQCEKYLSTVYSTEDSSMYRSYKVITFTIPFYKYPIMDALTIFIPLVLITILALFTFVQGPDFNDKIGNIATLMIVYVGLMPVINDSLPPTTKITLIDIVLYCQLLISVLCLIRGYQIKEFTPTQFDEYQVWSDGVFIFCVVIAIITALVLILLLVYYCINKAYFYNLQEKDVDESDRKLNHWVSPHMYPEARSLKTQIERFNEEKGKEEQEKASNLKQANKEQKILEPRSKK